MKNFRSDSQTDRDDDKREAAARRTVLPAERKGSMRLSMHDGVAVWCDCCSCQAEPYWLAAGEESEIELGD